MWSEKERGSLWSRELCMCSCGYSRGKSCKVRGVGRVQCGGCKGNVFDLFPEDGGCCEKMSLRGPCSTVWPRIVSGVCSSIPISRTCYQTEDVVVDIDFLATLIPNRRCLPVNMTTTHLLCHSHEQQIRPRWRPPTPVPQTTAQISATIIT